MATLKERRAAALKSAQTILDTAKAAGRDVTDTEYDTLIAKRDEVKSIDGMIAEAATNRVGIFDDLGAKAGELGNGEQYLNFGSKALAERIHSGFMPNVDGVKALAPAGTVLAPTPLVDNTPLTLDRPLASLLDLLPVVQRAVAYTYLRQVSRTNNAAPVAPGALKPTSLVGLEKVTGRLRVVAHLSEGIDKYVLQDNSNLSTFIATELTEGIRIALENQVLNGTGTGETFVGLNATSGVQLVAAGADRLVTLRSAITAVETMGIAPSVFVVAPADWQKIETTRTANGGFDVGGPVDAATRRAWGTPVAVSTVVPAGTAWLMGEGSVVLGTDNSGITTEWGAPGDSFQRNLLLARTEGRFSLDVLKPAGVVKITLPVTP